MKLGIYDKGQRTVLLNFRPSLPFRFQCGIDYYPKDGPGSFVKTMKEFHDKW